MAYLSIFALSHHNATTNIALDKGAFQAHSDSYFADTNFVWNLFGLPHPARSISRVVRKSVFVFDDFVFDLNTANVNGTFDLSANFTGAPFENHYTSASTLATQKFSFSVSSAS